MIKSTFVTLLVSVISTRAAVSPITINQPACDCQLVVGGVSHCSTMFTNPGVEVNVEVTGDCEMNQLRMFLVGGGGQGIWAGGGSGYLRYLTMDLSGEKNIRLTVGDHQEASSVIVNNLSIVAEPGDDYDSFAGGDGYSGGSGRCESAVPCRGGSDGGDGDDGREFAGHGTGENVTNYKLDNWLLSPGAGGDGGSCALLLGAGGGGVLVSGSGPRHDVQDGEGYGGGGAYCSGHDANGQQGVILMEILNFS